MLRTLTLLSPPMTRVSLRNAVGSAFDRVESTDCGYAGRITGAVGEADDHIGVDVGDVLVGDRLEEGSACVVRGRASRRPVR